MTEFDDPQRVAINRVYTGKGDGGHTQLVGGQKVPKASARIAAYGEVDELNAFVGRARMAAERRVAQVPTNRDGLSPSAELEALAAALLRVQHQLFNLGSILATLAADVHPKQPRIRDADSTWLEEEMDRCNAHLAPLRSFVLPGGGDCAVELHVCRTVCRRVERAVCGLAAEEGVEQASLTYLNRLSDAFFVWSRWTAMLEGTGETLWSPNAG